MSVKSEFEKLLKESDHFADVINTHRAATCEAIASFIAILVANNQISHNSLVSVLNQLEQPTGKVSIDSERRIIAATIREISQSL